MTSLVGKYRLFESENMEGYLVGLGVGQVLRKVQSVARPYLEIKYMADTDEWQMITNSPFNSQTIQFRVGQTFDDRTFDARKCKTTARIEEEKMILEQVCEEGPEVVVTKEKVDDENLLITMRAGELATSHRYRKVLDTDEPDVDLGLNGDNRPEDV